MYGRPREIVFEHGEIVGYDCIELVILPLLPDFGFVGHCAFGVRSRFPVPAYLLTCHRCGFDVSVQYGANQPEYDLIVARGDPMLKGRP